MPATLGETASQTAGPYVHIGLTPALVDIATYPADLGTDIAGPAAEGERIRVTGTLADGTDTLITDALIEVWQANAAGHYAHPEGGGPVEPGFRGWGRVATDFDTGLWAFDTIKPGPTHDADGILQAAHISLWIVARGINIGLTTRMYFADDPHLGADPVLRMTGPRRNTLIAARHDDDGLPHYHFDIHLQGDSETVFFDV